VHNNDSLIPHRKLPIRALLPLARKFLTTQPHRSVRFDR
jgi:hypothetical protein